MSGEVSDESAAAIGRFLGAEHIITGDFSSVGNVYRYRANAINVEQAVRTSISRLDVAGGREMRSMIRTLAKQPSAARTASQRESRDAVPRTAGAFLDRGITLASQGEWEMAILDFTDAINLNPSFSAAYLLRGRAEYASVSNVIEIAEDFERVGTWFSAGRQPNIEQTQAYGRAIADFTEAIRLDGNNAVAYSNRGEAYLQKGDVDNAIADFNQAIRLNPRYAWAYNNRGVAYGFKDEIDRAIADYTHAIRHDPQFSYPYYNRGNIYLRRNDYDRAIADFTQAIQVDPNYANAYFQRGFAYSAKGDYDRCIADLTQGIRIEPSNAGAYFARGYVYYERGNANLIASSGGAGAGTNLGEYARGFAANLGTYFGLNSNSSNRDRLRRRTKEDWDRAIADYTQAIRLDPYFVDAYVNRAELSHLLFRVSPRLLEVTGRENYRRSAEADLEILWELDLEAWAYLYDIFY